MSVDRSYDGTEIVVRAPEDALRQTGPVRKFQCPLSANTYGIEFLSFRIRDPDHDTVLFEVAADPDDSVGPLLEVPEGMDEESVRSVRYEFPARVLRLKAIGTALTFRVGMEPVPSFRIIERHYFRNSLLKSFDFQFGFCIPGSTNSFEQLYVLPSMNQNVMQDMISHPWETQSDTFYFVDGKLVMHNKAFYSYRE
eukprot:ANDGO_02122.mRNA.1 Protein unc-119